MVAKALKYLEGFVQPSGGIRSCDPLVAAPDPRAVMQDLMDKRYPVYALADLAIETRDVKRDVIVQEIVEAVARHPDRAEAAS